MAELEKSPQVTPYFFIHDGIECVQVRIGGNRNFEPVFPVDSLWLREDGVEYTYADRWPEEYGRFKSEQAQVASGTPLETMIPTISPETISMLKAVRIYTVEALASVDGANIKSLGGQGYKLKEQAQMHLDRFRTIFTPNLVEQENVELRARLAALEAALNIQPVQEPVTVSYDEMTDDELKQAIADKFGSRPRGNPNRDTLLNMLTQEAA